MQSSKGKKGSSGLKILWIPGRKKHNRKGVYNPTKSNIPQYHANQQRKTDPWSLGGTSNQTKIINADLHDNLDVGMATATGTMGLATIATNNIGEASGINNPLGPPSTLTNGGASCSVDGTEVVELVVLNDLNGDNNKKDIPSSNQFDTLELIDECEEKDRNYSNAESSSSLLSSNNDSRSAEFMHNSATLAIGETRRHRRRNSYNNSKKNSCENFDSIDHIKDNDAVDAVKIHSTADEPRLDTFRQKKKKNKKKIHAESTDEDETEERSQTNEKLVTCMYYSLVCWDCSIS
ncbi:uncharacterized protein LOC131692677 isoform X3 [Topomyia yanbarensis]|nr:uncharacterized protein LOC131692677 isoform X3 [Topomyia yanbarensis]XP_058835838.1 uncharacterized protein LOC131692677 isoform X3 [Topomyia yanbarensis]